MASADSTSVSCRGVSRAGANREGSLANRQNACVVKVWSLKRGRLAISSVAEFGRQQDARFTALAGPQNERLHQRHVADFNPRLTQPLPRGGERHLGETSTGKDQLTVDAVILEPGQIVGIDVHMPAGILRDAPPTEQRVVRFQACQATERLDGRLRAEGHILPLIGRQRRRMHWPWPKGALRHDAGTAGDGDR